MKVKLVESENSEEVHFQNGEYSRTFKCGEQPFDVTADEWKALRRTKLLEQVEEPPAPPPQGDSRQSGEQQQSQSDGDQQDGSQPKRGKKSTQN
jgi:hypothetical protein